MPASTNSKRLFFAIWPQARVRKRIQQVRASCCPLIGRWIDPENLHVTLVFLGKVEHDRIALAKAAASKVIIKPFQMHLDLICASAKKGMIWMVPRTVPITLLDLVSDLNSALGARGFELEDRTYRPHVTLIRKLPAALEPCEFEAIQWNVRSFALVESGHRNNGRLRYVPTQDWELRGR